MNKEEIFKLIDHIANCVLVDTIEVRFLKTKINDIYEKYEDCKSRNDKAIEYNNHLIEHAKYHLNLGHLKKMNKILQGSDENV